MLISLIDWNVNGIRASLRKDLENKILELSPDFLCIQEIKCQDQDMIDIFNLDLKVDSLFEGENLTKSKSKKNTFQSDKIAALYTVFYHTSSVKKGYSGTAILVKNSLFESGNVEIIDKPFYKLGIDKFDSEGRLVGLKMMINSKKIFLLNGYYPQGGREGRLHYKVEFYAEVAKLLNSFKNQGYELIVCGDLNTTLGDIDLARPKENKKTTGCLPFERAAINWLIDDNFIDSQKMVNTNPEFDYVYSGLAVAVQKNQLIDTFRHLNPDLEGQYTYWDQITRARERNVGWRIDYWLISKGLIDYLHNSLILNQVMGSDHCPVLLELKIV
jgi:exodeoxyribonuclease III